jgi:ferredoxin
MDEAKGYYQNIGDDSQKVEFNPEFMPTVSLSQAVLEADIIISLPKFKTHGLTVITGAIKNSYGFLPGALKAKLHKAAGSPERFHEMVVDVFRLRVPDLFILDAVVGMEGNGPASPDLRDIGLILASDNAAAMDSVMAVMMGLEPTQLRFLQKAKELGLGENDLDKIEIIGELKKLPDYKIPPLGGEAIMNNEAIQEMIHSRTLLFPQVAPDLCTACETCIEQCPVSTFSINGDIPQVETDTCITCFCCQEICPEKAITLK